MITSKAKINRIDEDNLLFEFDYHKIKLSGTSVTIDNQKLIPSCFVEKGMSSAVVGGIKGKITYYQFINSEIELIREVFQSNDLKLIAVRFVIKNISEKTIELNNISPFEIWDNQDISINGRPFDDWSVFRLARQKNETPTYVRPSIIDEDFKDAVFNTTGLVAGKGVAAFETDTSIRHIEADPAMILNSNTSENKTCLFIGVLGQSEHLTELTLDIKDDLSDFNCIKANYTYDGIKLSRNHSSQSHWLLFFEGSHENEMLHYFADINVSEYDIIKKTDPLAIYCSWYFYNIHFTQNDLEENCNFIKSNQLPIDVFVIDNCWMDDFGSYEPNNKFPSGMSYAAQKIKQSGMRPGIWTAPFIINKKSRIIEKYPDIFAVNKDGEAITFTTCDGDSYIIDPTKKDAQKYIYELYTKLKSWGFTYHKLDWLRAIPISADIRFSDPKVNRVKAYRLFLKLIREALGEDAYLAGCGGICDGSNFNYLDSYRTSRDSRGHWYLDKDRKGFSSTVSYLKANLFRNYTNKYWTSDPDAAMLRRRETPFIENEISSCGTFLSLGKFTDEEARTIVVAQFLAGGNCTLTEKLIEIDKDRLSLYRHIIPNNFPAATILDFKSNGGPTCFLTKIDADCKSMGSWYMLTVSNWKDEPVVKNILFDDILDLPQTNTFAVSEFFTGEFFGLKNISESLSIEIPAHGVRVFRLTEWDFKNPKIVQTDYHVSGGGNELFNIEVTENKITGEINNRWHHEIKISAGFPSKQKEVILKSVHLNSSATRFSISKQ